MLRGHNFRRLILVGVPLLSAVAATAEVNAGAFGIREQSAYFTGDEYAGAAAGGDISSMFWNPAATATLEGFNTSSSYTGIIGSATENATGGLLVTGVPISVSPPVFAGGLTPTSTNVGTNALVPASYWTLQLTDQLYAGIALNAPFGLITKPDNGFWAGSPLASTTRVFSLDANPTVAYKITPTLTVGAGVQIEYFEIKLDRDSWTAPLIGTPIPFRSYQQADDTGVGFTAGAIWQPFVETSLGLGYRSQVNVNVNGSYVLGPSNVNSPFALIATSKLTLPDEATFSFRQAITPQLSLLGTVEWDGWSSLGNVSATNPLCPGGVCETLNLNYRDGWFYSLGAEYAYSPALTLRTGIGYEVSPITDATRDILLPDADRIHLGFGASYKWSDKLTLIASYSHIFFANESFCMAEPTASLPTTHCVSGSTVLLMGNADTSADIVSLGANYKFYGPEPLEPLK
ncbi:MAG: OmpP1/FadL family transporter [Rhodomicrobium sp.]